MVRFLADASLHHAVVTGCARREPGIDFLSAQSAKLDGMSDPDVQPAAFQKRIFPFRVDGVRGFDLSYLNANVARTFNLGGRRTFQFRVDMQNLLNRQHYANPELNPTSTNFGQVRAVNNNVMRFITFNGTFRF